MSSSTSTPEVSLVKYRDFAPRSSMGWIVGRSQRKSPLAIRCWVRRIPAVRTTCLAVSNNIRSSV
jgi:hypothetical protein